MFEYFKAMVTCIVLLSTNKKVFGRFVFCLLVIIGVLYSICNVKLLFVENKR